ncbi:MAG TPA: MFS transporter [Roseateles sp.]
MHLPLPADTRDALRSNPALRAVLLTDLLVLLGDLSMAVFLPWWITSRGGAAAITAFSMTVAVAAFIIAPAVSPFGDRLCKGRLITRGLAALGAVAATLTALSFAGFFSVAGLAVLAVVQVAATSFVGPAREAVLAELVAPPQLPLAIRLRKTVLAIGGILGPLLAGALLGGAGVTAALCGYGALLAAALLAASRIPRAAALEQRRGGGLGRWWGDLSAGLRAKWQVPMERGWTLVNFVVWIFQGPAVGLLIPVKVQSLGLTGHWLGLGLAALSAGVLLGSLFGAELWVGRLGRFRVRVGLGVLEGLALAVVGWATSPAPLLAGLAFAGFCNAAMSLVGATHRALAIPRDYRVRLIAASAMTTQIAGTIGPALVGMALTRCSVAAVYTAWGLLMAVSVLGFLLVPRFKEFLTLGHDQVADWYRLQYPAVFGAPQRPAGSRM